MAVLKSSNRASRTKLEAQRIAASIPRHRLPGFLFVKAHGTRSSIHRYLRSLVRDSSRELFSPVMEGRIARELARLLKINKYKRRIGNDA